MASHWPRYRRYMAEYERRSRKLNDVLYQMCRDLPGHTDEGTILAKVWIIGRTYAAGIERHAEGGLDPIVSALRSSSRWLDPALRRLAKRQPIFTSANLKEVAKLHHELEARLRRHTRNGNQVRSFVSKYLHFHAPIVPIFDSVVNLQLRTTGWYPWRRALAEEFPVPASVDSAYWQHCVRIAKITDEWTAAGLVPTTRNIDSYVYQWRREHPRSIAD